MEESEKAEFWLEKLERVLEKVRYPPNQRASCAVSLLQGEAYDWLKLVLKSLGIPNPLTWEFFFQEFKVKYVTDMYRDSKWKQFLNLKQRNLSVVEYEKEFSHLSKYAPELVLTEAFQCRQFEDGLHDSIKRYLAPMTSLQTVDFYQLVQAAMKVERLEMSNKERSQKKKFSRGASSSSGKIARESQAQSEYSSAMRDRRQGSNVAPSTCKGASVRQGEILECTHCHRRHLGVYRLLTGGCFRCGSTEHFMENCPNESRDNRNPQSNSTWRSVAPPSTRARGKGRNGPSQHRGQGGTVSETMGCPMPTAPTRAYAMKAHEDQDAPEVIAGIFSLFDIERHALIDPGSIHSYVCIEHVFEKVPAMEKLAYDMHVTSPLGIALV